MNDNVNSNNNNNENNIYNNGNDDNNLTSLVPLNNVFFIFYLNVFKLMFLIYEFANLL